MVIEVNQPTGHARHRSAILLLIAAVASPLWASCGVGCMAEGMSCCEVGPVPAVASPCCPSSPELSERGRGVATLRDLELTTVLAMTTGGSVSSAAVDLQTHAPPPPSLRPPPPPSVSFFLLHSALLR
jgi:hypothetical protein